MVHDLMKFSFVVSYTSLIMLLEYNINLKQDVLISINKGIIYLCSSVIILSGVIYSNQIYLYKDLIHRNTLSFATMLLDRIYTTPGYQPDMEVVFVGQPQHSMLGRIIPSGFENITSFGTGVDNRGLYITYHKTLVKYFQTFIPSLLVIADENHLYTEEIAEEINSMPPFPALGSCRVVDNKLIVKLTMGQMRSIDSLDSTED